MNSPAPQAHDSHKHHTPLLDNFAFGQDIDVAIAATAGGLTVDQLFKASGETKHRTSHLLKAGLGAAVTIGALKLFQREHKEAHDQRKHHQTHRDGEHGHEHRPGADGNRSQQPDLAATPQRRLLGAGGRPSGGRRHWSDTYGRDHRRRDASPSPPRQRLPARPRSGSLEERSRNWAEASV